MTGLIAHLRSRGDSIIKIETLSGVKDLELFVCEGKVKTACVDMGKAEFNPSKIPVSLNLREVINHPLSVDGVEYKISCVSMGNPHCVVFVSDLDKFDVCRVGAEISRCGIFPQGVNVEFIEVLSPTVLKLRVWERGSGETLACGTGACAGVALATVLGHCQKGQDIKVILLGGELIINYSDKRVLMTGEAVEVFSGSFEYDDV